MDSFDAIIVGSGAAGLCCAEKLYDLGYRNFALVTENMNSGTSRNTGSDKQTFYKLSMYGSDLDSIDQMAKDLFAGKCMDGDIALCEASLSAQGFLHLCSLGVPFPQDNYGQYAGYRTDHDNRRRATSVGPYTSKKMTEALEKSIKEKGIRIIDNTLVTRLIKKEDAICGVVCFDINEAKLFAIKTSAVVLATGGPSGMYSNSVYPVSQHGASSLAYLAGAKGKNLTEWQCGLASVRPRWNVSGTYMQVMPTFVSVDDNGVEREFVKDFFKHEPYKMLSYTFLKGYQWPFDVRKLDSGSSIIDILVYLESQQGRKVYLDYRKNPIDDIDFEALDREAYDYLKSNGACFGSPFERLMHMNQPAVSFYRDKGVDLETERLEIRLCVQHNNGGISTDAWWKTCVNGLFACGEAAGTHGVYRPGGSALNAGQVGAIRVATYLARTKSQELSICDVDSSEEFNKCQTICYKVLGGSDNLNELRKQCHLLMDKCGAAIRNSEQIKEALTTIKDILVDFENKVCVSSKERLVHVFRFYDELVCQYMYLNAMLNYAQKGGKSRGSALYSDSTGHVSYEQLPSYLSFSLDDGSLDTWVQEVQLDKDFDCSFEWRKVRPIPSEDLPFEVIWKNYRETYAL